MGIFKFINDIGNYEARKVGRTKVSGLIISTCETNDEGYETAVCDKNGAHPVERYPNKKDAVIGHEKWVGKAKKLKTIKKLGGFGGIVKDEIISLERLQI